MKKAATRTAKPTKPNQTKEQKFTKWFWRIFLAPFAVLFLLLLLAGVGVFGSLPTFEELENPKSNLATQIISADGEDIGNFSIQNRVYVSYEEISPFVVAALVSTEDARYYRHSGIDFKGLGRVAVKTITLMNRNQGGGSTISQQLAKNLFPRDTVYRRNPLVKTGKLAVAKLKEWIVAVKLEHNYTKEEIIAMYLNTVEYGNNAFGIKSAAQTFFSKTPAELNIQEAATLVGMVNAPTRYSPRRNYDRSLARRNTVISRMDKSGYITGHVRDSLCKLSIELDFHPISHDEGIGTYFREMIRLVMTMPRPKRSQYANDWDYEYELRRWDENPLYGWIYKNRKSDGSMYNLYKDGLKIYVTIDSRMQRYAEQALYLHLKTTVQPKMDEQVKRSGTPYRGASKSDIEASIDRAVRLSDRWREMKKAGYSDADILKEFAKPVDMTVFSYRGPVDTTMTPLDSVKYYKTLMRASFVAVDPISSQVKAYVGGVDFKYFKYDMAKQGKRQVGSTIKPFVYTFAIDQLGLTPCTEVPNLQTTIESPNGKIWTPREASKVEYNGEMHPLSWGLANSRNNYSAWIMKAAHNPDVVADFIHKLGMTSYIYPAYALCLGSSDASPYELAGAYSTFVNKGISTEPIFVTRIEDQHGNVISSFIPQGHDAISEQVAYTMITMLQGVVNGGTASRLRYRYGFTGEMGGKTGTSQNNSDAWFVGVTPKLVGAAWMGGDDMSINFASGGEGAAMALPIYADFLKMVYADKALGVTQDDKFLLPYGGYQAPCRSENPYLDSGEFLFDGEDDFF